MSGRLKPLLRPAVHAGRRVPGLALTHARRLAAAARPGELALFHEFARPPSGGGHQFLRALRGELQRRGIRVDTNVASRSAKACLVNSFNFRPEALDAVRRRNVRVVHRVDGPVTVYRGVDDGTDARIAEMNRELAHATVFQSRYSLERHRSLGIDLVEPTVIVNAPDPAVFNAAGRAPFAAGGKVRLITTSWSDNPNKGADVIAWLARTLDASRYEITFVGRTPVDLGPARIVPPVVPRRVAELLRAHDVFVFPSLHEACSNALLEALACGLPAVAVASGSNPELLGDGGLLYEDREQLPDLIERVADEWHERQRRIHVPALGEVADRYVSVLGLAP